MNLIICLIVMAFWALARWTAARPPKAPELWIDRDQVALPDDITIRRNHLVRADDRKRLDVRTVEVEWPPAEPEQKREAS